MTPRLTAQDHSLPVPLGMTKSVQRPFIDDDVDPIA